MKSMLSIEENKQLLVDLKKRFEKHAHRHPHLDWTIVENALSQNNQIISSIWEMEQSGGEPDVICLEENPTAIVFMDCSKESPKGRRSLCYDREALESRKDYPPANSVLDMAKEMNIQLLSEVDYRILQSVEAVDLKTSSWLLTPIEIRKHGGAIFGDNRYEHVFVYHNGAQSYYAARGFRGKVVIAL